MTAGATREDTEALVIAPCLGVVQQDPHAAHDWSAQPTRSGTVSVLCRCPGYSGATAGATQETQPPLSVQAAYTAVMREVEAIGKNRRVTEGPARFVFRGVDDVMNALHGPLARHGLIVLPGRVLERLTEQRATKSGSAMWVVHLHVQWDLIGPDGSGLTFETWGEGQDSGDKATGKAHSMAYKTAMLQAFHIPTEDLDDADSSSEPSEPSMVVLTDEQAKTIELLGTLDEADKATVREHVVAKGYPPLVRQWDDATCKDVRHRAHQVAKR